MATTGCGVAVLDTDGTLLAYATATPPAWVKTAGAAEAWALLLTLRGNPSPPLVLTDCMAVLHTTRAGPAAAARGRNTDARIWKEISDITGGCYKMLLDKLVWMPAHTSAALDHVRVKSNGRSLTTAEWRANQLVDTLAKRGALVSPLRNEADKVIKAAGGALQQAAARLGAVTLAANVHMVEGIKEDGTVFSFAKRDSSTVPKELAKARDETRQRNLTTLAAKQPAPPVPPRVAQPLVPLTREQARGLKRRAEHSARLRAEDEHLQLLVESVASRGQQQLVTAADCLAALRQRVSNKHTGLTDALGR